MTAHGRDAHGCLQIHLPAPLAALAHQLGAESEFIVYASARALDPKGAGLIPKDQVARELKATISPRQLRRVLTGDAGAIFWTIDQERLRLRSQDRILETAPHIELPASCGGLLLPVCLLTSRQRRGAAILAAIIADAGAPRSNGFISRFSRVDRKTLRGWLKDPVIRERILQSQPQWVRR